MKKRKQKQGLGGYLTLEACLLLPTILMIQILFLYLSMYCYNRSVMEQCAIEAAFRGTSNMIHQDSERYETVKQAADYLIEDRLLSATWVDSQVQISGKQITVSYRCHMNIPFAGWIFALGGQSPHEINVKKSMPTINQVRLIRIQEFGKELLDHGNT